MSSALRSVNQEAIGVKLNAMFLRTSCILPDGMGLIQTRFAENWMSVENATAAVLDVKIRNSGWDFICLLTAHSGVGISRTADAATSKAMDLALKRTADRFNAAELAWSRLPDSWDFMSREQRFTRAISNSVLRLA